MIGSTARDEDRRSGEGAGPGGDRERRRRLLALVKEKSFRRGRITLSSGKESDFYFDMKPTAFDPEGLSLISELLLSSLAGQRVDYLGGLEMGAVPIVVGAVQLSHAPGWGPEIPGFFVRKEPKQHGTRRLVEGVASDALAGKRVVMIDDVTTTGGSVLKAVEAARSEGAVVDTVLTVVDRAEGAAERLRAHGAHLVAILTASDFGIEPQS